MVAKLIQKITEEALKKQAGWAPAGLSAGEIFVEKSANLQLGDYAVNIAFSLAKELKKPPQEVAQILAESINFIKPPEINEVRAADGYVNFFLSLDFLRTELNNINKNRSKFGRSDIGRGKRVIVEYSQPNIAKQMHIGHLRTTALGDALANIYETLGYKVVRWNYLGDWGTQFGKLLTAYKLWGNKKELEINPIPVLNELYVRFHQELKEHLELERRGQEEFSKLERGDKENRKLWEWFKKLSLKEFEKIYGLLGIRFDTLIGESFFEKELGPLVTELRERGIAEAGNEGAIIIKLDAFKLPPALIQKADGASLYLTRDIAALKYRLTKYKPDKILYVVGNEQALHFQQLSAVAEILGLLKPEHVKYGLVLGEDKKKMSTREGEAIPLTEVIKKAVNLARDVVAKKNPALSEKERAQIASTVAIGALKYEMLKDNRNSDIVFSWDKMLDFTGNSAPYLQYTYARLSSILKKAGRTGRADLGQLSEEPEIAIIKMLLDFPDTIAESARTNLTSNLALFLYGLANLANRFYETTPVIKDDNAPRRNARLKLIETSASILKTGLGFLGINVLDRI